MCQDLYGINISSKTKTEIGLGSIPDSGAVSIQDQFQDRCGIRNILWTDMSFLQVLGPV